MCDRYDICWLFTCLVHACVCILFVHTHMLHLLIFQQINTTRLKPPCLKARLDRCRRLPVQRLACPLCSHSNREWSSTARFKISMPSYNKAQNESSLTVIPMCALRSLLASYPRHDQGQVQRVLHANVRAIVEIYARDIIAKYAS